MDSLWYKDAVMYELPVQAFCDGNSDGNGDFQGLIQKLDYLRDLSASAISLLPFYPSSPQGDGYEMAHDELVDPRYGTLRDFQAFLREAQTRGMRVLIEHQLFQHYPNVNVDLSYVRRVQLKVMRHWLDMGVDGLRLGAVAHDTLSLNVEAQERQPFSMLNWTRRLIALRKQYKTLAQGKIEFVEQRNEKVLPYGFYWFTLDRPSREVGRRDPGVVALEQGTVGIEARGLPAC